MCFGHTSEQIEIKFGKWVCFGNISGFYYLKICFCYYYYLYIYIAQNLEAAAIIKKIQI